MAKVTVTVAEARRKRKNLKAAVLSVFYQTDGIAQLQEDYLSRIADDIVAAAERVETKKRGA